MLHVTLGMQPGYVWTINDGAPMQAASGSRVEWMFMNPTMMMHPMHLQGHHFQVVDVGRGRCAGPMRAMAIVPPPDAVQFDKQGDWYLHCHNLYQMAVGMMTSVQVARCRDGAAWNRTGCPVVARFLRRNRSGAIDGSVTEFSKTPVFC